MRNIYLDHNATTPVHPEVLEAMLPYFSRKFGNASSMHSSGREAKAALEDARAGCARILGCRDSEIVFTSGGTESDNYAVKGAAFANRNRGKHVITSPIEHHAVSVSCEFLEKEGFGVTYLPVDSQGIVDPDQLRKSLRPDTTLVTIMHANNETGVIQDVKELVRIAHEAGALFHTDAVQTTGKIAYSISELGCDLLSISAHKLYGPKGVGLLFIKSGTKIQAWNQGGGHERGRRAGTENVAGIAGLTRALEIAARDMAKETAKLNSLTTRFYERLRECVPDIHINGSLEKRVPNTLNISFKGVEGEAMILSLDMKGISVSSGSACTSGTTQASHVLIAMGLPGELAHGSVRFSFGRSNSEEDIDYVVDIVAQEVQRLRNISPLYTKSGN
ncbi:MAG: cysteine desulfurase NifS [candidate division Zixibacteria bacterium RBG_16_53_22]|nr:MAG: cysteine desulfurase NifS [candidate division Zixibacteria bacterium RBG_16_53_22]